ncbi:hypothetical protein TNCV_4656041 [Trichonephila clavipes]|nr:hypothetical protein TNCV_4656041 [Trichonephila clavipes]
MNKIQKTPAGLDCSNCGRRDCTAPIIADKVILEFVQNSKNINDADPVHEYEMNNAAPVATSYEMRNIMKNQDGRGSLMVKVSDGGWLVTNSSPVPLKDPPCRRAMQVKSVESSNVFPLVWCGS